MSGWACLRQEGGCPCRCHAIAAGRRAGRRSLPASAWRPGEITVLRQMLRHGALPEEVAEHLSKTYGRYRSRRAVTSKAVQLGLSFRTGWYSEAEVKRMLGVNTARVRAWREAGWLPAARHIGRIKGLPCKWWRIEADDLARFVERYAGAGLNPATIRDPALRARAEVAARANQRRVS